MKKLGVLVLAEPENGGTFQYTLSMIEALKLYQGLKITLYTNVTNTHYAAAGFSVNHVQASLGYWIKIMLRYFSSFKGKDPFEDEDLVLAPIYSPLLLLTKRPFFFTLHDLQEYYFPENFTVFQRIWRKLINSLLTKKASKIICESEFVRNDIIRFLGVARNKIAIITAPPLFAKDKYSPFQIAKIKTKYNLPERYLFYPAQFWPHKNHLRLVEAFARIADQFPEVSLLFTGQKRDQFKNVFDRVEELGLTKHVIHIGYVDQSDLAALYLNATSLVMPSLFESVSLPIYEAFQYGLAVCSSDAVALSEQVGNAGLLFNPMSIEEISGALSQLLGSSSLRDKLVNEGKLKLAKLTKETYSAQLGCLFDNSKGI